MNQTVMEQGTLHGSPGVGGYIIHNLQNLLGHLFLLPLCKVQECQNTIWLFNIAMENGPFIDDFPIKTTIYRGFSMAMLNNQMVTRPGKHFR